MNIHITFLTAILFLLSNFSSAQHNADIIVSDEKPITSKNLELVKELPLAGTYQVIFKNETEKRKIADEILFLVNEKREFDNIVFLEVDKNTEIKILPFKVINATDFLPITSYIIE